MYEFDLDDGDDERRGSPIKKIVGIGLAVALATLLFVTLSGGSGNSGNSVDSAATAPIGESTTGTGNSTTERGPEVITPRQTTIPARATPRTTPTTEPTATTVDTADSRATPTTARPPATDAPRTTRPSTTVAPTTVAPTTTERPTPTTSRPTTPPQGDPQEPYPREPDGSPTPVLGIYDADTITLSGAVPSAEAKRRLEEFVVASSNRPDATLISLLTVNPAVPDNVGFRVIDLEAPTFAASSAEISAAQAADLDRAVGIMNLLPSISAVIVGHAGNQTGNADANFELSERRALNIAAYFVDNGVDPSRVSARAVGQNNPLSVGGDEAARRLNRRVEIIFIGLLAEPPSGR